ncbi:unnamed protein product [Acanthoscelides obtectus]|uniref:Uncharacterized protein n=1 Tax=Acanthoscelides obtectus TaxID=200917 RepID=A0A9P0L784_ACAOB|nr:unnamed protein product [Acanthoscelides obtectus]CAK1658972.1 hypothetical protein AOBTE_LOCUS21216 [Acanthoscelides obtectus]
MNQARGKRNRGLIYKYPRTFVIGSTIAALLALFSRPIYDVFFSKEPIDYEKVLAEHRAQKAKRHGVRKESKAEVQAVPPTSS